MEVLFSASLSLRSTVCNLTDIVRLPGEIGRLPRELMEAGLITSCARELARSATIDEPDAFGDCLAGR